MVHFNKDQMMYHGRDMDPIGGFTLSDDEWDALSPKDLQYSSKKLTSYTLPCLQKSQLVSKIYLSDIHLYLSTEGIHHRHHIKDHTYKNNTKSIQALKDYIDQHFQRKSNNRQKSLPIYGLLSVSSPSENQPESNPSRRYTFNIRLHNNQWISLPPSKITKVYPGLDHSIAEELERTELLISHII